MTGESILNTYPAFSLGERDRRWRLIRGFMEAEGFECLLVAGFAGRDKFEEYISNDISGGFVVFPRNGDPTLLANRSYVVPSHMESVLRAEPWWVSDVRLGARPTHVAAAIREVGCESSAIGVIGLEMGFTGEGWIPYGTWVGITHELPNARFIDATRSFAELIAAKGEEELTMLRRAAEVGELACEAMLRSTRPGVGENEIYAAIVSTIFSYGANASVVPTLMAPIILQSGPDNPAWGPPKWLLRGQAPRVVQPGDMVQAEIFTRYGGLDSQAQLSIALSPVDPVNRRCGELAKLSYQEGLQTLRPGKTFGEVVSAMESPLQQEGAGYFTPLIHSMNPNFCTSANGVGMEKLPGVDRYRGVRGFPTRGADVVLRPGMVFELEPNASIGKHKVIVGGTVVVGENGPVPLNTLSTEVHFL